MDKSGFSSQSEDEHGVEVENWVAKGREPEPVIIESLA